MVARWPISMSALQRLAALDALDPVLDVVGRLGPLVGAGVVRRADDLLGVAGELVAVDLDLALLADEDRPQARAAVAVEVELQLACRWRTSW